jgi:polyphosphate kinase 2 (PPK2 family)
MKIDSKDFRVREGDKINLKKWPTIVKPVYKSKEQYKKLLEEHVAQLSLQQQLLYASNRHAVLLIFQAMDAAGKDGAIRHVMSGVNPQGCQVFSFKHPSAAELEHDFLWRTSRDLPERGRIGIFNRSYYEEVLIVRVHPEILRSEAIPDTPPSRQEGLERPVSFDRGFGEASPRQRNPHRQVLPPPFEGRAAKALSGAYRRAGQKLEIQPCRYRGAEILDAIHEGV